VKTGDTVHVAGVLDAEGRPMPCTLQAWHPNPYATGGRGGEWDYETADGRWGCRDVRDIFPWPLTHTEES
jgi:hypothetical protein